MSNLRSLKLDGALLKGRAGCLAQTTRDKGLLSCHRQRSRILEHLSQFHSCKSMPYTRDGVCGTVFARHNLLPPLPCIAKKEDLDSERSVWRWDACVSVWVHVCVALKEDIQNLPCSKSPWKNKGKEAFLRLLFPDVRHAPPRSVCLCRPYESPPTEQPWKASVGPLCPLPGSCDWSKREGNEGMLSFEQNPLAVCSTIFIQVLGSPTDSRN